MEEGAASDYSSTVDQKYKRFLDATKYAEASTFKPQQYTPRRPWISSDTLQKLKFAKHLKSQEDPQYKQAYKEVKRQARQEKRDWTRSQIGNNYELTPQLWRHARRLKKGFQERKRRLVVGGKQVPWSQTHEAFAKHLSNTQWGPSAVTEDEIEILQQTTPLAPQDTSRTHLFTMEEMQTAIAKLRKGRAPGPDGLRPDLIRMLDHYGEQQLLEIYNQCWVTKTIPEDWKKAIAVSFYKGKGDDADASNYRPISLLNTTYKVYAAMLQERLANKYDGQLRNTQYGFRRERSTAQPLFILRRLQDYSARTGVPFHCLFIDWKQAFDKLDHSSMLIALKRLGVHQHYIDVVQDIYTDPKFYTVGIKGEQCHATPHTGIGQGCPLSPYLFIMVRSVVFKTSFNKLQHLWRSSLPRKTKVHIFQANIVSTLIYGVATLTMEPKHFHKLESWYFPLLRQVLNIKASYYSRISNQEVWRQAGKPTLPSQLVLSQQFRLLLQSLQADRSEPQHHVMFGPAYKDRISMHKNHKRGPPPPHWLGLVSSLALEFYIPEVESYTDQRQDLLGLKHYLDHSASFPDRLVAAPTRHPFKFSIFKTSIGSAWLS